MTNNLVIQSREKLAAILDNRKEVVRRLEEAENAADGAEHVIYRYRAELGKFLNLDQEVKDYRRKKIAEHTNAPEERPTFELPKALATRVRQHDELVAHLKVAEEQLHQAQSEAEDALSARRQCDQQVEDAVHAVMSALSGEMAKEVKEARAAYETKVLELFGLNQTGFKFCLVSGQSSIPQPMRVPHESMIAAMGGAFMTNGPQMAANAGNWMNKRVKWDDLKEALKVNPWATVADVTKEAGNKAA